MPGLLVIPKRKERELGNLSPEALAQLLGSRPMRNLASKKVASVVRVTLEVVLQSPQTCKHMNTHMYTNTHTYIHIKINQSKSQSTKKRQVK